MAGPGEADQLAGEVHVAAARLHVQVASADGQVKARQRFIEGAAAFVKSWNELLAVIDEKGGALRKAG